MLKAVKYKFSEVPKSYWDFIHKHGSIDQSKPYLEFIATTFDEPLIIGVFDGENLVAGSAFRVMHRILHFPIRPEAYFGPVVKDKQILVSVLECIAEAIKRMSLMFSVVVSPKHADILSECHELSNWYKEKIEFLYWDISGSLESLWRALPQKKRYGVNRGRREGIIIEEIETPEQVEQFFELYSMSMRRSRLDPGSLLYYKNLIAMLKPLDLATGFLALHPKTRKPLSSKMLLLGMQQEATFLATGFDYEYRKLHAQDLLTWHCVEFLKSRGVTLIDYVGLPQGNSARAQGIRAYKLAWTGVNSYRYPSYVLSCGNFGLNAKFCLKSISFLKMMINVIKSL